MFGKEIIVCFVIIFATTVHSQFCRSTLVDLPDVCFNPSLTTDCSALLTTGYLQFDNVQGVILNAYDSSGNLVDTFEDLNVIETDVVFFYSFSGSNVTTLEFTFIWIETANAIKYGAINQCFEDQSSCSPVFNVQPCHATRIQLNYEARFDLIFDRGLQENSLKGSIEIYQANDSTPWCFQYTSSFYLKEVSFVSRCQSSVILEYYNNNSLSRKPFLELGSDQSGQMRGFYTEVKEPIKKFCMRCGNADNIYVEDFEAYIVPA